MIFQNSVSDLLLSSQSSLQRGDSVFVSRSSIIDNLLSGEKKLRFNNYNNENSKSRVASFKTGIKSNINHNNNFSNLNDYTDTVSGHHGEQDPKEFGFQSSMWNDTKGNIQQTDVIRSNNNINLSLNNMKNIINIEQMTIDDSSKGYEEEEEVAEEESASFRTKPGKNEFFKDVFQKIIKRYEKGTNKQINIQSISEEFKIQHRKVYDFFSLLSFFGVCRKESKGCLEWISMENMKLFFINKYTDVEIRSIDKGLKEIFELKKSPSLGEIATSIISLFQFVGVQKLNMRQVLPLFSPSKNHMKTTLRRIYLVLNWLEIFGVIRHTQKVGEYMMLKEKEFEEYEKSVFDERLAEIQNRISGNFIGNANKRFYLSMLNSFSKEYIQQLRKERYRYFQNYSKKIMRMTLKNNRKLLE